MPAVLDLQRSNKRSAIHLAWLGPVVVGTGGALLAALAVTSGGDQAFWPFALQVMLFTLPLTVVIFGALAFWAHSAVDQRERRVRKQIGEPAADRSPAARAGRSVGRLAVAVLMGIVVTPLALIPVRIGAFLVNLAGVPIDAIPESVGVALGVATAVVLSVCSYRWLRSNPSSALQTEDRTQP